LSHREMRGSEAGVSVGEMVRGGSREAEGQARSLGETGSSDRQQAGKRHCEQARAHRVFSSFRTLTGRNNPCIQPQKNEGGRLSRGRTPPILLRLGGGQKKKFHRQVSDSAGSAAVSPDGRKRVVIQFVEGADWSVPIDRVLCLCFHGPEVRMVEDVEVFRREAGAPSFRKMKYLRLAVPVGSSREPKNVLADVAKVGKQDRPGVRGAHPP